MRPTVKATLMVLMVGLLSGCGDPRPESAPVPDRLDQATVDMITNTGAYPARLYQVSLAANAQAERCMRDAGIPWRGGVTKPNPNADEGGGVSVEWVRQHGYGMSDGTPSAGGQPEQPAGDDPRLRDTLLGPPAALAKLTAPNGVVYWYPRQGCAAKGHLALYGDLDTWARITYFPQEISRDLFRRATADERYQAALGRWRVCMAQYGYAYGAPDDVTAALGKQYENSAEPLGQRKEKEITIALRDVGCDRQAGLSKTGLELRREFAQTIEPAQRAEMARLSGLFARAEERSGKLPRPSGSG
ncbi:hypothetical protein [Longispora albida]|uniref:hypothetical protein n=1 Tax=Longispora albida TaxID=203523 RepID=UPI00036D701F|nr:hypothetical protein [Longispora albida]